jgi:hypothetical protein
VIDIDLRIRLTGADPGQDLLDQWEEGIERIWSDAYEIQDGENSYRVRVNVDWVTSDWHYLVRVSDTPFDPADPNANRPTMLRWYTDRPGGWSNKYQGQIAAHEAGHMMGLPDEYEGGATLPSFTGTIEDSIMSDLGQGPPPPLRGDPRLARGQGAEGSHPGGIAAAALPDRTPDRGLRGPHAGDPRAGSRGAVRGRARPSRRGDPAETRELQSRGLSTTRTSCTPLAVIAGSTSCRFVS